jgi:hypothetical protein
MRRTNRIVYSTLMAAALTAASGAKSAGAEPDKRSPLCGTWVLKVFDQLDKPEELLAVKDATFMRLVCDDSTLQVRIKNVRPVSFSYYLTNIPDKTGYYKLHYRQRPTDTWHAVMCCIVNCTLMIRVADADGLMPLSLAGEPEANFLLVFEPETPVPSKAKTAPANATARLEGVWKVVEIRCGSETLATSDELNKRNLRFEFANGQMTPRQDGKRLNHRPYTAKPRSEVITDIEFKDGTVMQARFRNDGKRVELFLLSVLGEATTFETEKTFVCERVQSAAAGK